MHGQFATLGRPGSLHSDGGTPLHFAVNGNAYEIAKLLLENGADVNAKNNRKGLKKGWTPLRVALKRKADQMAELLRVNGGIK